MLHSRQIEGPMIVTEPIIQLVNSFFESYAHAIDNFDPKTLAWHYSLPCTLLSDESYVCFTDITKLESAFAQVKRFYAQHHITHARAEVWNKRQWTDKIVNAKVHWEYFDADNKPLYGCDYHYVLKPDKNNQLKIVLAVSVNEKEQTEAWLQSRNT